MNLFISKCCTCKSQKSRWVLFFIFISSLLSLVYFALTYPTTGGLSILVTLIKQNLFCCYLPPSRQVWTSNPNQFAEDEDDDTFSFSVRIAAQDVLLVSEWNSFNIQFTPSVLVRTLFSYGAHLLCYNWLMVRNLPVHYTRLRLISIHPLVCFKHVNWM